MFLELQTKKYGLIKFQISEQDEFLVTGLRLCVSYVKRTNSFYIMTTDRQYLHRIIMQAQKGDVIDHINHDTLNNTRENLRVTTTSGNLKNSYKAYTDTQKLKKDDIKTILTSNKTNKELAKMFNVSNCLISNIKTGKIYADYLPEISRLQGHKLKHTDLKTKKAIKKEVLTTKLTMYQLSKKLNMPSSRLYQIRNGKVWGSVVID